MGNFLELFKYLGVEALVKCLIYQLILVYEGVTMWKGLIHEYLFWMKFVERRKDKQIETHLPPRTSSMRSIVCNLNH